MMVLISMVSKMIKHVIYVDYPSVYGLTFTMEIPFRLKVGDTFSFEKLSHFIKDFEFRDYSDYEFENEDFFIQKIESTQKFGFQGKPHPKRLYIDSCELGHDDEGFCVYVTALIEGKQMIFIPKQEPYIFKRIYIELYDDWFGMFGKN
jgi:hypothetical protein